VRSAVPPPSLERVQSIEMGLGVHERLGFEELKTYVYLRKDDRHSRSVLQA
jgi:hypothetical protein